MEAWIIGALALGIPALLIASYQSIKAIVAGGLFAGAILAIAISRFRGARTFTLDTPRGMIVLSHPNAKLARRFGIRDRRIPIAEVAALRLTRLLDGARHGAPGARINLRLADGSRVPIADFARAADGLTCADMLAGRMGKPVEKGPFGDQHD